MGKTFVFVTLIVIVLSSLAGCQPRVQVLQKKSPSYILISRFHPDLSHLQSVLIKGKKKDHLYKGLDVSEKHIVPKNAVFSCPAATQQYSWTYDIVLHYSKTERLFVLKKEGCSFLTDAKNDLILYPTSMPDLDAYFK